MHVPNKRIKKPAGAPKRAMSSFLSFSQLMRPEIRAQHPNLKNTDVSSVLAQKWHEASDEEKRPHIQRELKDREKYHRDMARWKEDEHDRSEANKAQRLAEVAISEESTRYQSSLDGPISRATCPSMWAAMIDLNETEDAVSGSPVFDEAMEGFWDVEEEEVEGLLQNFAVTSAESSTPSGGSNPSLHSMLVDTHNLVKSQRLVKRAKQRKALETMNVLQPPMQSPSDVAPTPRQLEVLQKRQVQQQQYQMYQQHILNQKMKCDRRDDIEGYIGVLPDDGRLIKGEMSRGPMMSAGDILEGSRLQLQYAANHRPSAWEAQQQYLQPGYQGMQGLRSSEVISEPPSSSLPVMSPYAQGYPRPSTERFYYGTRPYNDVSTVQTSQPPLGPYVPAARMPPPSSSSCSSSSSSSSAQPMRAFQFEEQDQHSVMQTLMAVHRATASKAGDSETLRSLDRIQTVQGQVQHQGQVQGHQSTELRMPMESKVRMHHPQPLDSRPISYGKAPQSQPMPMPMPQVQAQCNEGFVPLTVQQQERQNQTERMQLNDRQAKQIQHMLLLQQLEQDEQNHQHSSSLESACSERSSAPSYIPQV
jgi:HMG (high mobility group) box